MGLPPDDPGRGGVDVDFRHLAGGGDDAELIQPAVRPAAEGDANDLAAQVRPHLLQDVGQGLGLAVLDRMPGAVVVVTVAEIVVVAPGAGVPLREQAGYTQAKAKESASGRGAHDGII